eukprot:3111612-Prymnesium_polylepis.1
MRALRGVTPAPTRYATSAEQWAHEAEKALPPMVASLHTYEYGGEWGEGAECVLCLEPFQPGESLRVLPCRH